MEENRRRRRPAIVGDGRIVAVGTNLHLDATRSIDAAGRILAPGFIDIHTHAERGLVDPPGADNFLLDGVTTVIGGLTKQTTRSRDDGVPGFQNIPLLGYLFKTSGKKKELEDLLIFITPHILKSRPGAPVAAAAKDAGAAAGQ
jgi:predicted amidohydrolase YtcJ